MNDSGPIILILLIGILVLVFFGLADHAEQERQIRDLCMEYYKQINKTKDNNPKITGMCLPKKFSIKEYSEILDDSRRSKEIPEWDKE